MSTLTPDGSWREPQPGGRVDGETGIIAEYSEARKMLDTFASAGATGFDLTKEWLRLNVPLAELARNSARPASRRDSPNSATS